MAGKKNIPGGCAVLALSAHTERESGRCEDRIDRQRLGAASTMSGESSAEIICMKR
ncbi:MAG: hypothetical protein H6883_00425 [Rhodobiaceae bacterium]|nr:hypothetical protein [Rhodobiaceae bacterium]